MRFATVSVSLTTFAVKYFYTRIPVRTLRKYRKDIVAIFHLSRVVSEAKALLGLFLLAYMDLNSLQISAVQLHYLASGYLCLTLWLFYYTQLWEFDPCEHNRN